ncbi:uncharacterized protein LOC115454983 [Manduca sexta]|uniref:uncharacterized protein LOC115454983 n=1 Tax=Manduca sexta TaxID=7130 RepID=UPI00188E3C6D|nr:uncharacterized protein LOC115454983 [Manduca sexta]
MARNFRSCVQFAAQSKGPPAICASSSVPVCGISEVPAERVYMEALEDDFRIYDSSDNDSASGEVTINVNEQIQTSERCDEDNDERREKRLRQDSDEVGETEFTEVRRTSKRIARRFSKESSPPGRVTDVLQTPFAEKYVISMTSKEILPKQFRMAKLLQAENFQNIVKIAYKGPYRVFIHFGDKLNAEKMLNHEKFTTMGYKCHMTNEVTISYGIVRNVDLDFDEKEAMEILKCEQEIVSFKRLKRLSGEGKWVDCETVRLGIKGSTLPPYVFGYECRFKVEPYTFPVSQCSGCWKFGHLIRACPENKILCPKCGEKHKNCDTNTFKCINCKGPHMALFKGCPMFVKEKEIRSIMSSKTAHIKKR